MYNSFNDFSPFGYGFGAFSVLFVIFFMVIAGAIIVQIIRSISQWDKNNQSPILTVDAALVTKRVSVHDNMHHDVHNNSSYSTSDSTYYATFQVESGDRIEFAVSGRDYGQLAEGDRGKLTFQGTRYLAFNRYL